MSSGKWRPFCLGLNMFKVCCIQMGIIIGQFRANNEAMGIESVKPDDAEHRQRQNEMIHGGARYSRDKIYIDDRLLGKKYHISNPRGTTKPINNYLSLVCLLIMEWLKSITRWYWSIFSYAEFNLWSTWVGTGLGLDLFQEKFIIRVRRLYT